jgi:hypothetical protein
VLTLAATALYWRLITSQDTPRGERPYFVAASWIASALVLAVSILAWPSSIRLFLVSLGLSTLIVWTFLGALSIGVALVPAVILAFIAASRTSESVPVIRSWAAVVLAATFAFAMTVVGLSLT